MFFELKRPGTFYGQCSEICGALHGFMPITIKAVDPIIFAKWVHFRNIADCAEVIADENYKRKVGKIRGRAYEQI